MPPQSCQLKTGQVIRVCNYPSIGNSNESCLDSITSKIFLAGSVKSLPPIVVPFIYNGYYLSKIAWPHTCEDLFSAPLVSTTAAGGNGYQEEGYSPMLSRGYINWNKESKVIYTVPLNTHINKIWIVFSVPTVFGSSNLPTYTAISGSLSGNVNFSDIVAGKKFFETDVDLSEGDIIEIHLDVEGNDECHITDMGNYNHDYWLVRAWGARYTCYLYMAQ